jgi:hypothetical protein
MYRTVRYQIDTGVYEMGSVYPAVAIPWVHFGIRLASDRPLIKGYTPRLRRGEY